jgi:hypothetical protein
MVETHIDKMDDYGDFLEEFGDSLGDMEMDGFDETPEDKSASQMFQEQSIHMQVPVARESWAGSDSADKSLKAQPT